MQFMDEISRIRKRMNLTQEQFAALFKVSKQAVQKWENGSSYPDIPKLIEISKRFDVSLDTLLAGRNMRSMEDSQQRLTFIPNYSTRHDWELYSSAAMDEYAQSVAEGLDVELYGNIFKDISQLPKGREKEKLADVLFDVVINAKRKKDYPYVEPSELAEIKKLRVPYQLPTYDGKAPLDDKILGAWMGRICGCMLGKTVEGIFSYEMRSFLQATDNYPMHRYVQKSDLDRIDCASYRFNFACRPYADQIDGMPPDDDTNYTVMAQRIIDTFGRSFTPVNVAQTWIKCQPKDAYCTAERVAFCNFIKGYEPPNSAMYKNPYREWIGAQIRADYYGYINPGNPELAAQMAWTDASVSHVKNGIYGAMFVAAMLAVAAVTSNLEEIISAGLAQIPQTSRLYEAIMCVLNGYKDGVSQEDCFKEINRRYDEKTDYGWCHTIPNAMIVAASLLYGGGDYGKSICMAVENVFDTDCNGATVGSVLGMAYGINAIPKYWTGPIQNTLHTDIFKADTVSVSELVAKTMQHIRQGG